MRLGTCKQGKMYTWPLNMRFFFSQQRCLLSQFLSIPIVVAVVYPFSGEYAFQIIFF